MRLIARPDTRLVLEGTVVRGDTLFGVERGTRTVRAVPVSEIESYEVLSQDAGRTIFALVGFAALVGGFVVFIGSAFGGPGS